MALLEDKVILITGAGRGIGRACAQKAAAEGAKLVITDINEDNVRQTAEIIQQAGGEVIWRRLDATAEADWETAIADTLSEYGRIDGLLNNVGHTGAIDAAPPSDISLEGLRHAMTLNLETTALGTRSALRQMKDKGGAILNIASYAGTVGVGDLTAYSCAKAGVVMLTRMAAQEALEKNWPVRVNSICPGFIDTPLLQEATELGLDSSFTAKKMASLPEKNRMGDPDVIADAAVYLLSDHARFVTGEELHVDGGLHSV